MAHCVQRNCAPCARRLPTGPFCRLRRHRGGCRAAAGGPLMTEVLSEATTVRSEPPLNYHSEGELDELVEGPAAVTQKIPILIKQAYGLGDAVQLTCVLQHLAKHRPDWSIDVATGIGKHSAFRGLCRQSLILDR